MTEFTEFLTTPTSHRLLQTEVNCSIHSISRTQEISLRMYPAPSSTFSISISVHLK